MREKLNDEVDRISSHIDAANFLEELSVRIDKLCTDHHDISTYLSAVSGFVRDYNESYDMKPEDFRRLCTILLESLYYE